MLFEIGRAGGAGGGASQRLLGAAIRALRAGRAPVAGGRAARRDRHNALCRGGEA